MALLSDINTSIPNTITSAIVTITYNLTKVYLIWIDTMGGRVKLAAAVLILIRQGFPAKLEYESSSRWMGLKSYITVLRERCAEVSDRRMGWGVGVRTVTRFWE